MKKNDARLDELLSYQSRDYDDIFHQKAELLFRNGAFLLDFLKLDTLFSLKLRIDEIYKPLCLKAGQEVPKEVPIDTGPLYDQAKKEALAEFGLKRWPKYKWFFDKWEIRETWEGWQNTLYFHIKAGPLLCAVGPTDDEQYPLPGEAELRAWLKRIPEEMRKRLEGLPEEFKKLGQVKPSSREKEFLNFLLRCFPGWSKKRVEEALNCLPEPPRARQNYTPFLPFFTQDSRGFKSWSRKALYRPKVYIQVDPWTTIVEIKRLCKSLPELKREYFGFTAESKSFFARDLCWYDLQKELHLTPTQIAKAWAEKRPDELAAYIKNSSRDWKAGCEIDKKDRIKSDLTPEVVDEYAKNLLPIAVRSAIERLQKAIDYLSR